MGFSEFGETPLTIAGLGLFGLLSVAREIGYWIKIRRLRHSPDHPRDDGFMLSSVLGLLALLISFTFSLSLNRYDARRELVVAEANALGTTWLRTQLLEEPARTDLSRALLDYVKTRVDYGAAKAPATEEAAYRETLAQQSRLWPSLRDAIQPIRLSPLAASLVATANDSLDLAATRRATRAAHVPERVLAALVVFAIVSAGMLGYEKGRFRITTTLLFLLLSLAVCLILDLDRPRSGAIQVSQQPMVDLWNGIRAQPETRPAP